MGRTVLNVDVDGTLTNGELFWEQEPTPNKTVIDYVRKLYQLGKYVIIIWSARRWIDTNVTVAWLIKYDVPFHGIYMQKGATDLYLDDKVALPTEEILKNLLENEMNVGQWMSKPDSV